MEQTSSQNASTTDEAAPVYDAAMLSDLEELFGRQRLAELLCGLRREIEDRLDPPAEERDRLGKDAHALVSVSGILGFTTLSQACIELERACLAAQDVSAPLRRVQAAAADTRLAIEQIRSRLA